MPDWDMNGDTTRTGYEWQIANLKYRFLALEKDYELLQEKHKNMTANFESMKRRAHEAEARVAVEIDAREEALKAAGGAE